MSKLEKFIKKHPLNIAFVVEATTRYADELLKNEQTFREENKNGFIDSDKWIQIAKDSKTEL